MAGQIINFLNKRLLGNAENSIKIGLITFIVLLFSCKKEKNDIATNEKERFPIETIVDSLKDEVVLDTIRSFVKNDTLFFKLKNASVSFINNKENCWKNIQITNTKSGIITKIKTPSEVCFEKNSISDFSANQNFLILHAIEKGIVSDGSSEKNVERYNCIFLDIEKGIISEKHSDLFCGGAWKNPDQWFIDDDEYYNAKDLFDTL